MTEHPAEQFKPGTFWEYVNPATGQRDRFHVDHAGRAIRRDGRPYTLPPWDAFWGVVEFVELVLVPRPRSPQILVVREDSHELLDEPQVGQRV